MTKCSKKKANLRGGRKTAGSEIYLRVQLESNKKKAIHEQAVKKKRCKSQLELNQYGEKSWTVHYEEQLRNNWERKSPLEFQGFGSRQMRIHSLLTGRDSA